jgi:hypothetical protein
MSLSFAVMISVAMNAGPISTAVGAGEQPRFSAESEAAQRPFGGIVGEVKFGHR